MACFALLCQTLRSTFGLPHFVFPGLRLVCSLSSFRSFWLEFGSPTDSLALLVSGRVSFPHRVGGAGGREKVKRMWKHGLTQPSSCCFLHLPAKKCFAMRTCQQGQRFAVSPPPVSPCSGRRAWKMPVIWKSSSEVSDRPHGPRQYCLQAPLFACPPMSWPLCKWVGQGGGGQGTGRRWKHFLPSFLSSRLLLLPPSSPRLLPFRVPPLSPDVTSYFRVRPRLQVRPASFGSVHFVRVYLRRLDTASPFTSIRPSFRPTEYVAVEIPTRGLVLQGTFA